MIIVLCHSSISSFVQYDSKTSKKEYPLLLLLHPLHSFSYLPLLFLLIYWTNTFCHVSTLIRRLFRCFGRRKQNIRVQFLVWSLFIFIFVHRCVSFFLSFVRKNNQRFQKPLFSSFFSFAVTLMGRSVCGLELCLWISSRVRSWSFVKSKCETDRMFCAYVMCELFSFLQSNVDDLDVPKRP